MTISRTIKINRVLAIVALFLAMASTSVAQEVNTGSTTPSAKFTTLPCSASCPHAMADTRANGVKLRQPNSQPLSPTIFIKTRYTCRASTATVSPKP